MARPKGSTYSPEIAEQICSRIAEGKSIQTLCRLKGMPSPETIFRWLRTEPGFNELYARAKEAQADALGEQILDISDEMEKDTHVTKYGDGTERESPNTEWISRARLRVDSRKWLMSKFAPKRYADKIVQQHTGADGGPLTIAWKKADE